MCAYYNILCTYYNIYFKKKNTHSLRKENPYAYNTRIATHINQEEEYSLSFSYNRQ